MHNHLNKCHYNHCLPLHAYAYIFSIHQCSYMSPWLDTFLPIPGFFLYLGTLTLHSWGRVTWAKFLPIPSTPMYLGLPGTPPQMRFRILEDPEVVRNTDRPKYVRIQTPQIELATYCTRMCRNPHKDPQGTLNSNPESGMHIFELCIKKACFACFV